MQTMYSNPPTMANWYHPHAGHGDWSPNLEYGGHHVSNGDMGSLQGIEFWQPVNEFPHYDGDFRYSPTSHSHTGAPWEHVQNLQSNVQRLELELASLRSQISEQKIQRELDAQSDRLKRALSSLESSSVEDQDEPVSSPDTPRATMTGQPKRRKYQRRPKPDLNAPIKPLTAYAQFAVDIRKRYSSQGLSFAEIAKHIGIDWQDMPDNIRDQYLTRAADEKQKYETKLRRYQETAAYREYHRYLVEFKAKSNDRMKTED